MGQCFRAAAINRKEWVNPYDYVNFAKMMEQGWLRNPYVMAVEGLLAAGEPWHKAKIVWAGDYGTAKKFLTKTQCAIYAHWYPKAEPAHFAKFPQCAEPNVRDFCTRPTDKQYKSWMYKMLTPAEVTFKRAYKEFRFIVNHTKKEFVDKRQCPSVNGWRVHPLPLLTSNENHSGGSYYTEDPEQLRLIGSWAGDSISVESVKPEGFTLIRPNFAER